MTLDSVQTQLDSCQTEVQQQRIEIRQLTAKSQLKESEVDNLKLQLSTANAELHRIQTASALHLEALRKQVATLEESAAADQIAKDSFQMQLSELRADYENYKIRAMSVLKKKTTEGQPPTSTKEATDDFNTDQVEREMLQRVVEALKSKITDLELVIIYLFIFWRKYRLSPERLCSGRSWRFHKVKCLVCERKKNELQQLKHQTSKLCISAWSVPRPKWRLSSENTKHKFHDCKGITNCLPLYTEYVPIIYCVPLNICISKKKNHFESLCRNKLTELSCDMLKKF